MPVVDAVSVVPVIEHPVAVLDGLDAIAYVIAPVPDVPLEVYVTVYAVPLYAGDVVGTVLAWLVSPTVTVCGVADAAA